MLYCVVCPGGGPSCLPSKYHTILELPRKPAGNKRSPLGWKSLFSTKQSNGGAWERKSRAETVTSDQQKVSAPVNVTLRPVSITSISLQVETIQNFLTVKIVQVPIDFLTKVVSLLLFFFVCLHTFRAPEQRANKQSKIAGLEHKIYLLRIQCPSL